MNYKTVLTNLYFLLIHSDGSVNAKEASVGEHMCQHEKIDPAVFSADLERLKEAGHDATYDVSVKGLRALERTQQVKAIAWLCLLANSDGFMDKLEWKFIYRLYCTDLKLPLDEILGAQKELSRSRPHFSQVVAPSPVRTYN